MKVTIIQVYLDAQAGFPFSWKFQSRISREVQTLVKPSAGFAKKYARNFHLGFYMGAKTVILETEIRGPIVMRKRELIEWAIYLPYDKIMTTPDAPKQAVRYLLTAICDALASVELDTTALEGQIDSIAEAVCDDSEMLRVPDIIWGDGPSWAVFETYFASRRNTKHPPKTARVLLPASEIGGPPSRFVKRPATLRRQAKPSRRRMPAWKAPKNMARALDNGDGIWEDARWEPLQLTAMSGTSYAGQDIPVIWQVEFDPSDDDFETANARLENSGITPDGYGWGRHIQNAIGMSDPALAARLQLGDCETSTCVIWVTSVDDCLRLIETTWGLIFGQ